jgi:hypothetical protein
MRYRAVAGFPEIQRPPFEFRLLVRKHDAVLVGVIRGHIIRDGAAIGIVERMDVTAAAILRPTGNGGRDEGLIVSQHGPVADLYEKKLPVCPRR